MLVSQWCWTLTTPKTITHEAPLSTGFSRQEYWSGMPFPSPGDLPDSGSNSSLLQCRQILYHLSHQGSPELLQTIKRSSSKISPQIIRYSFLQKVESTSAINVGWTKVTCFQGTDWILWKWCNMTSKVDSYWSHKISQGSQNKLFEKKTPM